MAIPEVNKQVNNVIQSNNNLNHTYDKINDVAHSTGRRSD